MAFIANQGIAPKGDRYDRSALVNDIEGKLYKRTEKGDFIYSSNNLETGSIGLNKYGNACISPVYSIFQPSGVADSDFLGRRLVRKDFIQEMVKWRQGVIYGQWRIHEADFLRLNIAAPSVDEQRLIGKLLDNLDALITLHQRKCQYRGLYGYLFGNSVSWESSLKSTLKRTGLIYHPLPLFKAAEPSTVTSQTETFNLIRTAFRTTRPSAPVISSFTFAHSREDSRRQHVVA